MWLAHLLTLSRIPIAIVFWLTYGNPWVSLALVGLAALTDAADGTVARWSRRRTGDTSASAGEWLDPLADKLFIVIVLGAIQVHDPVPWWIIGLILARELVVVPLAVAYRVLVHGRAEHAFQAGVVGKAATMAEIFAIMALITHSPAIMPLALTACVLGLVAAGQYIVRAAHARHPRERLAS